MNLNQRLRRVEECGFDRDAFPLRFNGHELSILYNDAVYHDTNRLRVKFMLYCRNCGRTQKIFGHTTSKPEPFRVHAMKMYVLGGFTGDRCQA